MSNPRLKNYVKTITDDGNGVVSIDNTDPSNPIVEFNGVNVDGVTITGDGTSGNPLVSVGGGGGGVTSVTGTSPIASSGGATPDISIADAVADGTTKGAASFNSSDFNSASGVIAIDYTNGQSASALNKGFLPSAD